MSTENQPLSSDVSTAKSTKPAEYVVVARRYRPQTFDDLVGQNAIATALSNAIRSNRIGHAYLFTGARGVGKTSTARILAKALNCVHGPTPTPCNVCDVCTSIAAGSDVDVIEIDGASNRGIDEIRQLRQNATIRPSRSRFKIYIIDEVHMLTREAFNALLKTLEEPPEHVKFIFCTTEPGKIPITILSRCQRFDFSGIEQDSITSRLQFIVQSEGVEAESAALEMLARRAAGSMRDSQSLLEQLLAFAPGRKITVADVQQMLGIVGEEPLLELLEQIAARNIATAVTYFDAAMLDGVEPGTLLEQLLGILRDAMVAAAGAPSTACIYVSPANRERLGHFANRWQLDTICAAMQMIDQTLGRMRYSTQGRILAELLLVRLCQLENLGSLTAVLGRLAKGEFPDGPIVVSQTISHDVTLAKAPNLVIEQTPHATSHSDLTSDRPTQMLRDQSDNARSVPTETTSAEVPPEAAHLPTVESDRVATSNHQMESTDTADSIDSTDGNNSADGIDSADHSNSADIIDTPSSVAFGASLDDVNAAMAAATSEELPSEPSAQTEDCVAGEAGKVAESNVETSATTDAIPSTADVSDAGQSPHGVGPSPRSDASTPVEATPPKRATRRRAAGNTGNMSQKRREALDHPLVQQARTLFGMELDTVEPTPSEASE